MNIYVGNLPYSVSEETLRSLFEQFGQVASVKIMSDKFTGKPRGFAFVTMQNADEAQTAINALNDYALEGRQLRINEARPPQHDGNGNGSSAGNGGMRKPRSFGGPARPSNNNFRYR